MAECYGSWLCEQQQAEIDKQEQEQNAVERVSDELYEALSGDLYAVYEFFIKTKGADDILKQIAQQRYPKDFGLDCDDF